jgi:hypothetical protein
MEHSWLELQETSFDGTRNHLGLNCKEQSWLELQRKAWLESQVTSLAGIARNKLGGIGKDEPWQK